MEKEALGQRIREAREGKGISRRELAKTAGIGEVYLGEIERGLKMPSLTIFIRITEALELPADYILRDELTSGKTYIYDDITKKLNGLTPRQRKTAADILDAYLRNI